MKVYELMCKIKGTESNEKSINLIINDAYANRVYISDVLDIDEYRDLHKTVEHFLENDTEYDGDELEAWKRFIEFDVI